MISKESEEEALDRIKGISLLWNQTGLIDSADMSWLLMHARSFWILGRVSDDSWLRNRTEIFTLKMEIEDLQRQLKEKDTL